MSPRRDHTRMVLGGFVILIGVLALADNLFQINTRQVLQFWPVVFMLVGALKLSHARHMAGHLLGAGFMAVGVLMTLNNLELIAFHLRDWWPLGVIAVGIGLIVKDPLRGHLQRMQQHLTPPDEEGSALNTMAVMSGHKLNVLSQDLRQGEATAVMGGIQIDFRKAAIQSEATLKVFVVMGGIEIKVPEGWSVDCRAMVLMGGVEDKTVPTAQPGKRLIIEGFVMMGGVEIKN